MSNRKLKRPEPLKPHIKEGVVILRIPADTSKANRNKAITWARNVAKKINARHSADHYYEKGWN